MLFITSNVTSVFFIIFLLISPLKPITATTSDNDKNNSSFLREVCSRLNLNEDQCCKLSKSSTFLAYAATAAAVGTVVIPAMLGTMGFTAAGIIGAAVPSVTKIGVAIAAMKIYFSSGDCKKNSAEDNECSKK
ncbi:unnamed protein product [Adineta steineri]|uniref:Uncharacterized protein n=1 Tax=Adineta steineri TaxID=433720 RepID=A0A814KN97_9BILA|nr:unnamed protein product [Adineta steineri]CAF3949674.1 unnamed protein product [Adineta steineri]